MKFLWTALGVVLGLAVLIGLLLLAVAATWIGPLALTVVVFVYIGLMFYWRWSEDRKMTKEKETNDFGNSLGE